MFGQIYGFDVWIQADCNMEDQINRTSEVVLAYFFNWVRQSFLQWPLHWAKEQMREIDRRTIEAGVPGIILMENAALRVVEFLEERYAPLEQQRM